MSYNIDLHVHTKFSGDTDADPEAAVQQAINSSLFGIAFTEHYSYEASSHAESLRNKYKDKILIFRGVEFSSSDGHCLVFGANTDRLSIKHATMAKVVQVVNENGGVVIPTHPYRGSNSIGTNIDQIKGLTAIEGYNGYSHFTQNKKAVQKAEELNIPYTGGSDAHVPREVGACFTEFYERVTYDNFLSLLKSGNYRGVDTRKVSRVWIP
jgi:predicted metal-dependent phosphoesterase TrpH